MYELTEIIMDLLDLCMELEERNFLCGKDCGCPLMEISSIEGASSELPISMEELIQNILEGGLA